MYIEPNTNIRILKNVPLDTTYDHTIYFSSATAQTNYFAGLTKYNLNNQTYQRVKRGYARVQRKAEDLYDCNYMMFQNSAYGNKWFYAFITSVEYVNNVTSEITFEIDDIQTWLFDFTLDQCFVEREHTITDNIGEHIEPERVEMGEYVFNDYKPIINMQDMCVCVSIVDTSEITDGTLYDGIYGSSQLWVYDSTDVQGINSKVNEYVKKARPDAILSMYMFPRIFINEIPETHRLNYGESAIKNVVSIPAVTENDTLDGYKPKNKKLYTYPYNYYHVDNASGNDLTLRYEFFDNNQPVVEIAGVITQPVMAILRPCSYKGVQGYTELGGYTSLNTESIQLNSYPICSWNVDSYQAWIAQNSIPLALNSVAGLATFAGLYQADVPITASVGGVENILSQFYKASIAADISKGNLNNGGANVANDKQQFYGGRCSVCREYAIIIDDFFSKYGYGVKRLKIPNTHSRPHWNYVKTVDCTATGSIPSDAMNHICSIHNKGITYWKNGNEVGNYSLDNSPI